MLNLQKGFFAVYFYFKRIKVGKTELKNQLESILSCGYQFQNSHGSNLIILLWLALFDSQL